ncbi:MAG: hypothetical protein HQK52_04690 [Oligoflexia bacterium]|nr:hypothetical protein [Oligoflexia bacterium]
MSKDSIRDKITKLQQESEAILKTKNLNADVRFFIQSMMSILEIVVAVLLEKKTRKNSSNSGLPPSKNNGSNGNRNKNSGQRANLGDQIQNTRNITNEEVTTPAECSNCGIDLSQEKSLKSETRKKIDILYEIITTVVTAKIVECPKCG